MADFNARPTIARRLTDFRRDLAAAAREDDERERAGILADEELEQARIESRHRLERKRQAEAELTRSAYGGGDAGGPPPYWGKVIDELKAKLEAAEKEIARLNQVNFELVTKHTAELSKLVDLMTALQATPRRPIHFDPTAAN